MAEKINVLAVAPYEGLGEIISLVSEAMKVFDTTVVIGDLSDGVYAAKRAMSPKFDIIMSRGGTTELLAAEFDIPVVNIEVSGYDILRAVKLFEPNSLKASVVGFKNITAGAEIVRSLLRGEIGINTIGGLEQVDGLIEELKKDGYEVIIGDCAAVNSAKKLCLNGVLITSGRESVEKAFSDCLVTYQNVSCREEEIFRYKKIIKLLNGNIAVYKENGELFYSGEGNEAPPCSSALMKNIPEALKNKSYTFTDTCNGAGYVIKAGVFTDSTGARYVVYNIYESESYKFYKNGIACKNINDETELNMATLNESQKAVNGIVKRCEQLAINSCPVLIRGQHGTGKEDVAFFIYKNRRITDSLFISYDCQLICEEQWDSVFEDDNLDIFENSTIYIKEITALSLKNQAKLIKWLNKLVSSKNIKLLASSSEDINVLLEKNLFLYSLFELCAKAILRLKPLRDRKEDIESIISILLSDANIKYGKQVIGVEPAAMDMLKAFRWPNNITQLKNTVNQLVMCSEDTYVSRKDVCELLEAMDRDSCTDIILPPNKTLDEICEGIIEHVLEQENGNYTKVCKRLGISRSTLWRKSKGRKLTEIKL